MTMFPSRHTLLAILAAASAAACTLPAGTAPVEEYGPEMQAGPPLADIVRDEPSTLYARDGSIVQQDGSGPIVSPVSGDAPLHDIQRTGEGRMYILELYQNVIEERDNLTLEVSALNSELNRTRTALVEADARITALEANVTSLTVERESLEAENMALAGRLTTAQIRRLQAEKILLEIRLEESLALDAEAEADALAAQAALEDL
jgi:hypothetical protein